MIDAMLGSDREAVLSWPVIVVSRVLPVVLVVAAFAVPALEWSRLPDSRPGPLLFSLLPGIVGLVVIGPQVRRPVVSQPEQFDGPLLQPFLPGLAVALVRTKFGQLALGLFLLGEAAARSIGLTVESAGSSRWNLPFGIFVVGTACALCLAVLAGAVLRRLG
jgi:hypothetical protein